MAINLNIKLTQQQQQNLVLAILIIGGIIYAYWNYLLKPLIDDYNKKIKILQEKKKDLKDAREMVLKYDQFLQRAAIINKQVDFINKRLPSDMNISDIIKDVTEKAAMSNIKILTFRPEQRLIEKGDYQEIQIGLDLTTNFINLGYFLTNIGYINRLISPANLLMESFEEDKYGNNLRVNLILKTYVFK